MQLKQLIDVLTETAAAHDRESAAFERQVARGEDLFDNAFGQKYHEGATNALRVVIAALRRMQDHDEPIADAFAIALQDPDETVDVEPATSAREVQCNSFAPAMHRSSV